MHACAHTQTHTHTYAHRHTFKDMQANLTFLLRWYVSVCLASRVAWRFSDMLCRPKASLVKPAASSSDNLNMINIPLNGWVVHILFDCLLDLVISVHLMLSDQTTVTPIHTTFWYIKCYKRHFTLLFKWINFYKVLNHFEPPVEIMKHSVTRQLYTLNLKDGERSDCILFQDYISSFVWNDQGKQHDI